MFGTQTLSSVQADHLFLLVGANPLPNYVAMHLLARPDGTVYLVTSPDVVPVAERIRDSVPKTLTSDIVTVTDPSNDRRIRQKLTSYLRDLPLSPNSTVALNYTGGTKPMSLHAHEVLQAWCVQRGLNYSYSYLDPRTLSLRFPDGAKLKLEPNDCRLSLDQLVTLHGWQVYDADDAAILPALGTHLATSLASKSALAEWRQWCDWHLRTWAGRNQWKKVDWPGFASSNSPLVEWAAQSTLHAAEVERLIQWVQANSLKERKSELVDAPLPTVLSEWRDSRILADLHGTVINETGWPDNNQGYASLARFLDGAWLESYVFDCIQRVRELCSIHEARWNVTLRRRGPKSAEFEFDVGAIKGFQLFAVSCTTSNDRGQNKKRLLEVYTRARQIGGDEARVALVGGYHDATGLLREVNEEWFAPQDMIRVFGVGEWANLRRELETWFNWQSI